VFVRDAIKAQGNAHTPHERTVIHADQDHLFRLSSKLKACSDARRRTRAG
jgi:hypothetical protein